MFVRFNAQALPPAACASGLTVGSSASLPPALTADCNVVSPYPHADDPIGPLDDGNAIRDELGRGVST